MAVDILDKSVTEALRAWSVQHNAGVAIVDALKTCATICSMPVGRACFNSAALRAETGEGMDGILDALSPVMSEGERVAIEAGWKSGRVEVVMNAVIAQRELWAQSRSKIRSQMALPVIVLVMGSLVAPIPALFLGDSGLSGYLFSALTPLAIAFAIYKFCSNLLQARSRARIVGAGGSPLPPGTLDRLLLSIPVANEVERQKNISEFASLLSILIGAGVGINVALELCARALGNGVYRQEIGRIVAHVKHGNTISSAISAGELWPPEFISALNVGEKTGALEDVLARLARNSRERYTRAIEAFAEWLPRVAYGIVMLVMIVNILRMLGPIASLYQVPE